VKNEALYTSQIPRNHASVVELIINLVQLILQSKEYDINTDPKHIRFPSVVVNYNYLNIHIYCINVHDYIVWYTDEPNTSNYRRFCAWWTTKINI